MRKVLISRFGAFGDQIHCSHIPRLLKEREGFDWVTFQYNIKGRAIFKNNPFIDEHIVFDPSVPPVNNFPISYLSKRLDYMKESMGFEKVINLQNSIEVGQLAMESMNEYYRNDKFRREKYGKYNYYDATTIAAGYPEHFGMKGDLFFTEEEENVVRGVYEKNYNDKFVVIANISGSSKHKLFLNADFILKTFLSEHEDAVVVTLGDEACKSVEPKGDRIINRCGEFSEGVSYPFRQSMLMTKYANLVIGCESGLMVAATLLGAPTVQLMTAASIKNHGGDFPNDFSMQAPVSCSPCHKGPYEYVGCPKFKHLSLDYPMCVKFDENRILQRMNNVYHGRTVTIA